MGIIVDGEEDFRTILSSIMEEEEFKALVAQNGDTALRMIRLDPPDIMLTDVKMPGMDGWELLKKAKDLDPDLPVVIVAGFADIPGAVGAIKVGAHDYLAKPFDNDEVIRVVRRALIRPQRSLGQIHPNVEPAPLNWWERSIASIHESPIQSLHSQAMILHILILKITT